MVRLIRFLLLGVLLGVGCETTNPQKKSESDAFYRAASFEVKHPPSVSVAVDQGEGFAVHYFRFGGSNVMMGIYEGQRPRLFSRKENDLTVMRRSTTTRANIERGDDAWGVDSRGGIWRESVWSGYRTIKDDKGKSFRIPTMLHIWYFGVTEEQQVVFDAIVDSLEMH